MVISLSFFTVLILILLPGIIFRRFYYYGEFSKQFNAGHNLVTLLSLSLVPGIINLFVVYYFYDYIFSQIDLDGIIDMFKDINDSQYRLKESNGGISLKNFIDGKVLPFTGFLYLSSFIFGTLFGRMVRIVRLDAFFKILRFKNYWFYLFNGQVTSFRKLKHHKEKNKKYLFTKADILIDTETSPLLYSGYVADYELQENDCKALSKVMLENAERYSMIGGKKTPVKIPGNFFVVDCTTLKNINLTYVYQEKTGTLKSKIPNYLDTAFALSYFLCIPFFIFRAERIEWDLYNSYFSLHWFHRIIAYLLFVQVLSLFNVFRRKGDEFQYVSISLVLAKIIIAAALGGVLYLLVK